MYRPPADLVASLADGTAIGSSRRQGSTSPPGGLSMRSAYGSLLGGTNSADLFARSTSRWTSERNFPVLDTDWPVDNQSSMLGMETRRVSPHRRTAAELQAKSALQTSSTSYGDDSTRRLREASYTDDATSHLAGGGRTVEERQLSLRTDYEAVPILQTPKALVPRQSNALLKIRQVVMSFRQQLRSTTVSRAAEPMVILLRELADKLEAEVVSVIEITCIDGSPDADGGWQNLGGALPTGHRVNSSYEVMRQALRDTQQRCERLNEERMHQSQVHDELVSSLASEAEAKKRLSEQVWQQSQELTNFSRLRVLDEEALAELRRRSRLEQELCEQDAKHRIVEAVSQAEATCQELKRDYASKIQWLRVGLERLRRSTEVLRSDNVEQRRASAAMAEDVRQLLTKVQRALQQRVEALLNEQLERQASSAQVARDLEASLVAEQQLRHEEVVSWSNRHALLLAERDDLQARLAREVGLLQTLERDRLDEKQLWGQERSELTTRRDEVAVHRSQLEISNEQLRRTLSRLETTRETLDQELQATKVALKDVRWQLQEATEKLCRVEKSREQLADQLETQRLRLTKVGDEAMEARRRQFESQVEAITNSSKGSLAEANERLRSTEDALHESRLQASEQLAEASARQRALEDAFHESRLQASLLDEEAKAFRNNLERSKKEWQDSITARGVLEGEFFTARREHVDERMRLQAVVEQLEQQRAQVEIEVHRLGGELSETRRIGSEREVKSMQRMGALEAGIQDRDTRIEERERSAAERLASSKLEADAMVASLRAQVAQEALDERRRYEDERKRLQDVIAEQTKLAQESQEQYEKWRDSYTTSMRQAVEEGSARAGRLESEKEHCRSELSELRAKSLELQKRLEASESDLARVRYLLNESQGSIHFVRQEKEQRELDNALTKQQLQGELRHVSGALEEALRSEGTLAKTMAESAQRHREEQQRLADDLEKTKQSAERGILEREQRIARLRLEYESQLKALEMRFGGEAERDRARMKAILHENEQLRLLALEVRRSPQSTFAGSLQQPQSPKDQRSSLRSQVEESIMRLQQHTDELRRDVSRPSRPTPLSLEGTMPTSPASGLRSPAITAGLRSPACAGLSSFDAYAPAAASPSSRFRSPSSPARAEFARP